MSKTIVLTQARRTIVTIESNGNVVVGFEFMDADGKVYEKSTVQFVQVAPEPPTPDPSWKLMTAGQSTNINNMLSAIDTYLNSLLV